jgi:hypothetical protein
MKQQNKLIAKAKSGRAVIPEKDGRPYNNGPVKRFVFVDEKLFPFTKMYQAVHLARNLPKKVDDYMVEHVNESDETYLFIGFKDDLRGLKVEVQINGKRSRVYSPAAFYIPKGVRHRYKALSGEGIMLVTLLQHKYSWAKRDG